MQRFINLYPWWTGKRGGMCALRHAISTHLFIFHFQPFFEKSENLAVHFELGNK